MSLNRIGLAAALILLAVGSAAAQDVTYNALPGTDFTKYKTYSWVKMEGTTAPDSIVDQQIKNAVDAQLTAKGLTKVDGAKADLFVGYQLALDQERQWSTMSTGYGYGPRWGYAGGMGTATSTTINIGTIGLDMYDVATKQLVWRGAASKTIDEKATPEKREKNLTKAMAKLLKKFPPPAKK
ncbi:MAG: DUF4136 domain-containing protein [Bacteroidales bacterium]